MIALVWSEVSALVYGAISLSALVFICERLFEPFGATYLLLHLDGQDFLVPKRFQTDKLRRRSIRELRLLRSECVSTHGWKQVTVKSIEQLPTNMFFDKNIERVYLVTSEGGSILPCVYNATFHAWRVLSKVDEKFL